MNKLIIALVAILLSSSAFAGCGDWNGRTYTRCVEVRDYDHHRHGQSIGREIAEAGIGGAVAVAAIQIGGAIGGRIARAIDPPPPAGGQVVYIVQPTRECTYVPVMTDRGWDQQIRCP